ncbi:AAA family ATPase [Vagococcus humatus]|uniref:DNA topology modulation protein FlaR n=1 Tax=Vagococcus humatus TaxID=1889241 RepID=A0A429Z4S5_9ENTE|nr:AAA family ATPase [Vagococcus humatus]RST88684.1 hypothetical protein C7P63_08745 [Vagococcus humatus]
MKIRIIGPSGSGKTTLGKQLSKKHKIPCLSLDTFLREKNKKNREKSLQHFLSQHDAWIIEGVQDRPWCQDTFKEADIILFLDYPLLLVQYRVFKRTLTRMKKKNWKRKKFLLKRMFNLFKWNRRFYKKKSHVKKKIFKLNPNYFIIHSPKERERIDTIISYYL